MPYLCATGVAHILINASGLISEVAGRDGTAGGTVAASTATAEKRRRISGTGFETIQPYGEERRVAINTTPKK